MDHHQYQRKEIDQGQPEWFGKRPHKSKFLILIQHLENIQINWKILWRKTITTKRAYLTNSSLLVDMSWHDTNLALTWGNDTWTIWTDQSCLVLGKQDLLDSDHIVLWNTFSDADNKWHLSFNGFNDGLCSTGWWHVNNWSLGTSSGFSLSIYFRVIVDYSFPFVTKSEHAYFSYVSKDWETQMCLTSFCWGDTSNHFCSILDGLRTVEGTLYFCRIYLVFVK